MLLDSPPVSLTSVASPQSRADLEALREERGAALRARAALARAGVPVLLRAEGEHRRVHAAQRLRRPAKRQRGRTGPWWRSSRT